MEVAYVAMPRLADMMSVSHRLQKNTARVLVVEGFFYYNLDRCADSVGSAFPKER